MSFGNLGWILVAKPFPIGAQAWRRHAAGVRARSQEGLLGSSQDLHIDKSTFRDLQLGVLVLPNAAWKYEIKMLFDNTGPVVKKHLYLVLPGRVRAV